MWGSEGWIANTPQTQGDLILPLAMLEINLLLQMANLGFFHPCLLVYMTTATFVDSRIQRPGREAVSKRTQTTGAGYDSQARSLCSFHDHRARGLGFPGGLTVVLDQAVFVPWAAGVPSISNLWKPLNVVEMWPETKAAARSLWLTGFIFRIIENLHQASWFSSESQFLKCRRDRSMQSQRGKTRT